MQKTVYCDDKEATLVAKYVSDWGGYNHMPKPFKPMSEAEFIHQMSSYSPTFMDYRQVYDLEGPGSKMRSVHFYYFHDMGIAVVYPRDWDLKGGKLHWKSKTLYFRIGCDHKNTTTDVARMCYHEYHCDDCGTKFAVDSSG